ncbi:MAG TPA: hypothetical protein VFM06_12235 [Candidatus Limnocylindria bacterium]|nr:hypothetical protein [Candidatus Limnocylindria bacterium]
MTRREIAYVAAATVFALGASAVLFVGAMANEPAAAAPSSELRATRPRIFFDFRNTPPPARTVVDAQVRVGALAPMVPLQRGVSDGARDAAGLLLVVLLTATTLVVAHDRVVSAYRASLGGWRTQLRILLTGVAVLGLGFSAVALAWVVYLGYVATSARGAPFGVPAALQLGLAAFGVIVVVLVAVLAIGFSATAWRVGDVLFRARPLARLHGSVPSPVIAVLGATVLYLGWQLPILGAAALAAVVAYAMGAVVTARLRGGAGGATL